MLPSRGPIPTPTPPKKKKNNPQVSLSTWRPLAFCPNLFHPLPLSGANPHRWKKILEGKWGGVGLRETLSGGRLSLCAHAGFVCGSRFPVPWAVCKCNGWSTPTTWLSPSETQSGSCLFPEAPPMPPEGCIQSGGKALSKLPHEAPRHHSNRAASSAP